MTSKLIPIADRLYEGHLAELKEEPTRSANMAGRHPFAELRNKMPPRARIRAAAKAKQLRNAMDLAELRRALALSQQQLARKLRVNQPEVAKIEKRADMLLSTLGAVLRAMGADLKIVASFPDHDVRIRNFTKLARNRDLAGGSRS